MGNKICMATCCLLLLSVLVMNCSDPGSCVPDCAEKECGWDGCGGSCQPGCLQDQTCESGVCLPDCVKKTCLELGKACGKWDDGCGGQLDCGSCEENQVCTQEGNCFCEHLTCSGTCCGATEVCHQQTCCQPSRCADLGIECGQVEDGCGGLLDCGACAENQLCNQNGQCECAQQDCQGTCCAPFEVCYQHDCCLPKTCSDLGAACGIHADGCGGEINCGTCDPNMQCNQGVCECQGLPCATACCQPDEQCIQGTCCKPTSCETLGVNCGTWGDSCGGMLHCGTCGAAQRCSPTGQCECAFESCGSECCPKGQLCHQETCCTPQSCESQGLQCGSFTDTCGGALECGACGPNELCGVSGQCECAYETCDNACCDQGQVCSEGVCCTPQSCQDQGYQCGTWTDGCTQTLDCGACPQLEQCEPSGLCECAFQICDHACCEEGQVCFEGECCSAQSCQAQGRECGSFQDGCGGTLDCGACGAQKQCNPQGRCECAHLACGDTCCPEGQVCADGVCCEPQSCTQLGYSCGNWDDTCGGVLECGGCTQNERCNTTGQCECEHATCQDTCCADSEVCYAGACCQPQTCAEQGLACGTWDDTCGEILACGDCGTNQQCNQEGQCECAHTVCDSVCCAEGQVCHANLCCTKETCATLGNQCGTWDDGCGSFIECGECGENAQCNDLGQCECVSETCDAVCCADTQVCFQDLCCEPKSCLQQGLECGSWDDTCGGSLACGDCPANAHCNPSGRCQCTFEACGSTCCPPEQVCYQQSCCQPQTCESLALECGTTSDGCGNTLTCPGCGDSEHCSGLGICELDEICVFADPVLEELIRSVLGQPTRDLLASDLATITSLVDVGSGITDLSGMGCLVNLTNLELIAQGNITDVRPLAKLSQLITLDLAGSRIEDISPLANLVNLEMVVLAQNLIRNIDVLSHFPNLIYVFIEQNDITSLAPLAQATGLLILMVNGNNIQSIDALADLSMLQYLDLSYNQLSDLSVLADKAELVSLNLENNLVDDISALVANPGISGNTYLNLVDNPLMGCVDPIQNENLATLIARCDEGLVTSSCQ